MGDAATITLDMANLLADKVGEHGLPDEDLASLNQRAVAMRDRISTERREGHHAYLNLPTDSPLLESVLQLTAPRMGKFGHLVVLGIGGSSLGLRALAQALELNSVIDLHVVDNTDPTLFHEVLHAVDLERSLFVVISKSGGTLETVIALGFFAAELRKSGLELKNHIIAVTDSNDGPLRAFAEKHELETSDIPSGVGGRFSVMTGAGLVPAALSNVDVAALMDGGGVTEKLCFGGDIEKAWPLRLGLIATDLCRRGKTNLVFMPYSSRLKFLSGWFVQLWDESLGKNRTLDDAPTSAGQTAVPAIGATDQHAQLQLFLEGPNDKLLLFLRLDRHEPDITLGDFEWSDFNAEYVAGKSLGEVINAQQSGTARACVERHRPNATLSLPRLNARTMGELLMGLEIATTCAGYAFGVNPYDQPAVELGKRISRNMLGGEE